MQPKPAPAPRPDLDAELNNLAMSKAAKPLFDAVKKHIDENVAPMSEEFFRLGEGRKDPWSWAPGQLELLEVAKNKAKASGLWNFFLPNSEIGQGLTNLDYAYIAAELGKQPLASETLNCSAPDTGNMEVLERVGTPEQKEKWLKPLLNGEIRSAYAMTEPNVASSDAKNITTRAELVGGEWVINGEKYYISGAGDPRCKIMIVMVKTNPDAPRGKQFLRPNQTEKWPLFRSDQVLSTIAAGQGQIRGPDLQLAAQIRQKPGVFVVRMRCNIQHVSHHRQPINRPQKLRTTWLFGRTVRRRNHVCQQYTDRKDDAKHRFWRKQTAPVLK